MSQITNKLFVWDKKTLNNLITLLRKDYFVEGIEGYISDVSTIYLSTDISEPDLTLAIIDFLKCRVIELEDNEKLPAEYIPEIELDKCSICHQQEDDDGRCGCVNSDAY